MRWFALSVAVLALAACAESAPPGSPSGRTSIEIKVAPLTLPGLGDACYDVEVRNGAAEIVWSRGDFNVQHPADTTTLCARQFGNGPGGDISYVGPCDADSPGHTVYLAIDTLYDEGGNPLSDWQNPCPGSTPCKLNATCEENADTPVSFNLTIMRDAQQGFFDIAVNFDAIFCSAKVDCTYDAAGLEPIELVHDPVTGERTQTAVIGLACSAGSGTDIDTALLMSDIRLYCGDVAPTLYAGYSLLACDEPGDAHYGVVQAISGAGLTFAGAAWQRDAVSGAYLPSPLTVNNLPPVPASEPDTTWDAMVWSMLPDGRALMLVARIGAPTDPGNPFTAVREMRPAIATRGDALTFDIEFLAALEADADPAAAPLALPVSSDPDSFLLTRPSIDGGSNGPGDLTFTAYVRTGPSTFGAPIRLSRTDGPFERCDSEPVFTGDAVIATCAKADGTHAIHVWDLTDTPVDPGTGVLTLEPAVLTLAPADFTFSAVGTNDGAPANVSEVVEIQNLAFIRGTDVQPDRIFATAWLRFSNAPSDTWVAVHAARVPPAVFALTPPPYGQQPLATDPSPTPPPPYWEGSHLRGVVFPPAGLPDQRPVFLGAFQFEGLGYRRLAIRHDPSGTSHALARDFWKDAVGGTQLFPDELAGGLFHPNGDFFVLSEAWYSSEGVRRPFLARATPTDGVAMALPVPDGYTLTAVTGIRGEAAPALGEDRRLSGLVVDPDGERRIITWVVRARELDAAEETVNDFQLMDWSVHGTTDPVAESAADFDDLRRDDRSEHEAGPLFDAGSRRCPQTVDSYEVNAASGAFADAGLVVDPTLDTADLAAVQTRAPLTAAGFPNGTLVVREPVEMPVDLLPPVDPTAAAVLDPTHTAEGNIWSSTNPRPADVPAHVLQMASYHGEESLECDGEPCNKLYWNTAIAFDPTVPDCRLAFEATAARVSTLVGGQLPPNTTWPMFIGRVQLTTTPEEGQPASLACTQHPLGSAGLQTLYKPQDFDWEACYGFGTTGSPPVMSGGGECTLTADDYLMFEAMIEGGDAP